MDFESDALVEYGKRRTLIVAAAMMAVLLEILDTTIVNVALPTIQGNMGADLDAASWIVTAYLMAVIVALPLVPWLESVFGRKRYFVGAIIGFTLASAACGLSQSLDALVAFRILQGLFGGGIVTVARAVLRDTFPPEQLGRSQGLLAMGAVVGPSIGPTLGGILTDNLSWRWIFFINLLPGIIAAYILWKVLRDPPRARVSSDFVGLGLMVVGLGSLQYVLQNGERYDWLSDPHIAVMSSLAVAGTGSFVLWELFKARHPIVDLRILKNRVVALGTILSFSLGFTLFIGIVLGPQFTQSILGFTATMSGNAILIRALAIAAVIPIAIVSLVRFKVPPRYLLAAGFTLVGISGFMMWGVMTPVSTFWTFGWPLAVGGFGFGLIFVPLSVAVLSSVRPSDTSKASSMLSLTQQLGASVSTAIMITIIDRRSAFHYSILAGGITSRMAIVAIARAGIAVQQLTALVNREATTLAFADAMLVGGVFALAILPFAFSLKAKPPQTP